MRGVDVSMEPITTLTFRVFRKNYVFFFPNPLQPVTPAFISPLQEIFKDFDEMQVCN